MAKPEHRAIHHALDSILTGERAVAAFFGMTEFLVPLRDMRGHSWGFKGEDVKWWPTAAFPFHGVSDAVQVDENGEKRMLEAHGFTLVFVDTEIPGTSSFAAEVYLFESENRIHLDP